MSKALLNDELMKELFGKSESVKEAPEKPLVMDKKTSEALLDKGLITELFGEVPIKEKSHSHFSSYRHPEKQCTFHEFVMIVTRFPTGKEVVVKDGEFVYETRNLWFTVEEAVKRVNYSGFSYYIQEEQAKKYLDSLVAQGFFESRDGKYHKLMFCYHLRSGTYFFDREKKDSSRLATYTEL